MNKKMADVDTDPFGEHGQRTEEPTYECIPLSPVTPGVQTWESICEQEMFFRGREGGELYYIGSRKPLMTEGKLKSVGMIADILGKNRLCRLGFNIPVGKITAWQNIMLNKAVKELLSESYITRVDDIKLQEIAEKAQKALGI